MAINYSLVKLASKFGDKVGVPKFYARAQMNESISLKKFAKLISMQTTVSYADVTAVLVSMQENMIIELQRGNQIDFGELGKFRLQLTSEGAATAAEFKSDINIKGVNIQFIPGSDLANIFVGMEFEQVASRAVQKAALKAEKEGAKTLDIEEAKKKPAKDNASSGGDTTGGNTSGEQTGSKGSTCASLYPDIAGWLRYGAQRGCIQCVTGTKAAFDNSKSHSCRQSNPYP